MSDINLFEDSFFQKAECSFFTKEKQKCLLPVRDQRDTRSCYAFATVDVLYTSQFMKENSAEKGSEQELIDFLHIKYPPKHLPKGYQVISKKGVGNYLENALLYTQTEGLCLDEDWPFQNICTTVGEDSNGEFFHVENPMLQLARTTGRRIFTTTFDKVLIEDVKKVLIKHPIATSIYSFKSFQKWKPEHGIYLGPNSEERKKIRKEKELPRKYRTLKGHALTLVGYGTTKDGNTFFFAKNSYGPDWGHKGYMKIAAKACLRFFYADGYIIKKMDKTQLESDGEIGKEELFKTPQYT